MIEGVPPTAQADPDERGKVMHMLRCDDPCFDKFMKSFLGGLPTSGQGMALA
jgi:hypothetical protein